MAEQAELAAVSLDGFAPSFGVCEYTWGPYVMHNGVYWKPERYHVEFLAWYYHDYMGTHAYVQVWDYSQQNHPDQRWQYMLLLHKPIRTLDDDGCVVNTAWGWTIRSEYEGCTDYAQVGADIDLWIKAPSTLRFILE
jgi:hypothetical protein